MPCHTVMFTTHRSPQVSAAHIDSLQATPVCLCPCHTARSHTGHPMFQLLTLTHFKQHQSAYAPASATLQRHTQVTTGFNCSHSLQATPVCWCHATQCHTQVTPCFNCSHWLASSNTSLMMPCHTARSHTGHPMFQLLTLTHFKQHQSAYAPTSTTQQCSPHTGWWLTSTAHTHFICLHSLHLLTLNQQWLTATRDICFNWWHSLQLITDSNPLPLVKHSLPLVTLTSTGESWNSLQVQLMTPTSTELVTHFKPVKLTSTSRSTGDTHFRQQQSTTTTTQTATVLVTHCILSSAVVKRVINLPHHTDYYCCCERNLPHHRDFNYCIAVHSETESNNYVTHYITSA